MNIIYPSKKEHLEKAKKYNLIPVYKEYMVDIETPVSIFIKAGGLKKEMFLLESMEGAKKLSRYSFIGVTSSSLIVFKDDIYSVKNQDEEAIEIKTLHPLKKLEKLLSGYRLYKNPALNHFVGGAVGYISYDLVKYFENIKIVKNGLKLPEMMLNLTDLIIVFDHYLNSMKIIATLRIEKETEKNKNFKSNAEETYIKSIKKIEKLESEIFSTNNNSSGSNVSYFANNDKEIDFTSNFSKQEFIDAVEKAKKYITDGEAFQIVLSQRFSIDNISNPFNIYRSLRTTNPSPYMYYINFGNLKIIGSSPEPLIKISGKKILSCPIAGTKKRGANPKEERALVKSLLSDEKEAAEHNMLVDLSRNDLGRVCKFGSIKIKKYMSVEKYSHVIHLVSRIEGTLDKKVQYMMRWKVLFLQGH